jgi:hypothetical protein
VTAYWAWSFHPARIHAWELTEAEVQAAKRDRTEQKAVCGFTGRVGDAPLVRPFQDATQNHCAACWHRLHPPTPGLWEPGLETTPFAASR